MNTIFNLPDEYDVMLQKGLKLFGENKSYLIDGRIRCLMQALPPDFSPRRILDFGCGIGDATKRLSVFFPEASVIGTDTSDAALARAQSRHAGKLVRFVNLDNLVNEDCFDLCYINGVFHHIAPRDRPGAIKQIYRFIAEGGHLCFFENNPWNPGARIAMARIPFDKNAHLLSSGRSSRLLTNGGFRTVAATRFLFYFPRQLRILRPLEKFLTGIPLGAQYGIFVQKPQ